MICKARKAGNTGTSQRKYQSTLRMSSSVNTVIRLIGKANAKFTFSTRFLSIKRLW